MNNLSNVICILSDASVLIAIKILVYNINIYDKRIIQAYLRDVFKVLQEAYEQECVQSFHKAYYILVLRALEVKLHPSGAIENLFSISKNSN